MSAPRHSGTDARGVAGTGRRGRRSRGRGRAGRGHQGPFHRARRGRDFARHFVAVEQAHPRRPAVPGEFDFGLVREAYRAGTAAQRIAPHLIKPVLFCFLSPTAGGNARTSAPASACTTSSASPEARSGACRCTSQLSRSRALRLAPALRKSALTGSLLYWDAQVDDARYVVDLVRTAPAYGARVSVTVPRSPVS